MQEGGARDAASRSPVTLVTRQEGTSQGGAARDAASTSPVRLVTRSSNPYTQELDKIHKSFQCPRRSYRCRYHWPVEPGPIAVKGQAEVIGIYLISFCMTWMAESYLFLRYTCMYIGTLLPCTFTATTFSHS